MNTHPASSSPSTLRRLALLALGLLVVLTGIGVGINPASAAAPSQPQSLTAAGYEGFIRVYVIPPAWQDPDSPVTGYTVERAIQGQGVANKTWNVANAAPIVDTSAVVGTAYVYRARAKSSDGPSAWSELAVAKRTVGVEEWDKFSTVNFVNRQYQDFLGRPPTPAERTNAVGNLDQGAWTSGTFINTLVVRGERTPRHQIIRLYDAYFARNADHAGLDYWFDQITTKGKSINTVSNSFAASAEFKTTYGQLTNTQFVDLVYENVLDRNPSNADLAYWKGELDKGKINRGKLMTQFSESAENKGLTKGMVLAADVYDAMLGEASEGAELQHWTAHIQQGGNAGDYGTRLMLLNKY